jgi:hypothetical protein
VSERFWMELCKLLFLSRVYDTTNVVAKGNDVSRGA